MNDLFNSCGYCLAGRFGEEGRGTISPFSCLLDLHLVLTAGWETEHVLNSVPCNFDIITCKNLDDLHQATMEGKKKASKNTGNCASSKNNDEDCADLFRELEIKNLVDESETPKSSGQKRSYSLSSVSSLSVKKNSSISDLKSAICALEADVVEVKKL